MAIAKITVWCIALACVYGIVHDEITARICLSYFTDFHPPLGVPENPTILGICWGILATWWVGAALGVVLGAVCSSGNRPMLTIVDLRRPLAILFGTMAACAFVAGCFGYLIGPGAGRAVFPVIGDLPLNMQARFSADLFAHNASYVTGILGGIALCVWAFRKRRM